ILGAYKAEVTKRVKALHDRAGVRQRPVGTVWQRNFYERVIRGANELQAVRAYIRDNPGRWALRTPRDRRRVPIHERRLASCRGTAMPCPYKCRDVARAAAAPPG